MSQTHDKSAWIVIVDECIDGSIANAIEWTEFDIFLYSTYIYDIFGVRKGIQPKLL